MTAPPSKPSEHPAPWRWGEVSDDEGWRLLDANGKRVAWARMYAEDTPVVECASPLVEEQLRLAPEMEALLRRWFDEADPRLSTIFGATENLLAALDAARKVTTR